MQRGVGSSAHVRNTWLKSLGLGSGWMLGWDLGVAVLGPWDHGRQPLHHNCGQNHSSHSLRGDPRPRPPRAMSPLWWLGFSLGAMLGGKSGQIWGGGHSCLGACILSPGPDPASTPFSRLAPAAHVASSDFLADLPCALFTSMKVLPVCMHAPIIF